MAAKSLMVYLQNCETNQPLGFSGFDVLLHQQKRDKDISHFWSLPPIPQMLNILGSGLPNYFAAFSFISILLFHMTLFSLYDPYAENTGCSTVASYLPH